MDKGARYLSRSPASPLRRLNLNLILVLDALLAERNVSRAGQRLGLSQPAVSNALAQLRSQLGDPLFVRDARGVVPTERALALAGPVRAALATLETALVPAVFDPARTDRTFVLATSDFVEFMILPALLARIAREAPGVRLQVRAWPEHSVPPSLERGEVDLMLGFYGRVPPGHRDQKLFRDEFICIVRRDHPKVRRRLTLETYCALSHVLVSQDPTSPGVVDVVLAKRGLRRTVGLRISHFLMVPRIVATTDMVAAISTHVAETFARTLPLRLLPPPLPLPRDSVGQVWHERTDASPPHQWLRGIVADVSRAIA